MAAESLIELLAKLASDAPLDPAYAKDDFFAGAELATRRQIAQRAFNSVKQREIPDNKELVDLFAKAFDDLQSECVERPDNRELALEAVLTLTPYMREPKRELASPPAEMGMLMSKVRVGMKLKSLYGGPEITVTELTDKGFKYKHPPYHLGARIGQIPFRCTDRTDRRRGALWL